ncbi:transposase, partial [Brevibacillus panacihumi]|uniref:transposase n=1 Tax=Brevibacillus panacihumi TaxID=497735 RepID=UPI003D08F68D
MTQLQFNLNIDHLKESVMSSNIETVVKSTIVLVLNEFMERERDHYLQAAAYENGPEMSASKIGNGSSAKNPRYEATPAMIGTK